MTAGDGAIRAMTPADLETVRAWRNHASVRDYMFTRSEIAAEDHRRWFERCTADPARTLLIYEHGGQPQGFVQFSRALCDGVADWGFYTAPDAAKGTGRQLGRAALDHAFGSLGYQRIAGQAIDDNAASIRMHTALGFTEEGRLRRHFFDGARWHDLVLFGLLNTEWRPSQQG